MSNALKPVINTVIAYFNVLAISYFNYFVLLIESLSFLLSSTNLSFIYSFVPLSLLLFFVF